MNKEPIAIVGGILTVIAAAAPQAVAEGLISPEIASGVVGLVGLFGTIFGRSRVTPVGK